MNNNLLTALAKLDNKFRHHIINFVPFPINTFIYSNARKVFIKMFANTKMDFNIKSDNSNIKLWDISFNCPLFNAAGMFKNGEGYAISAKIGAGAYIAGTTTSISRAGNIKKMVKHPFMPYPNSKSSSNWMGLPNMGHSFVANRISKIEKIKNCPLGISISEDTGLDEMQNMVGIVEGMKLYDAAGVDFIELNLSCPNIVHNGSSNGIVDSITADKLNYIAVNFLKKRSRNLPVIVKYSNDITDVELFMAIDMLTDLGFDGINIGNTSTRYEHYLSSIHPKDIKNYNRFTSTFGGGLSGEILKENSLRISKLAVEYINKKNIKQEFNIIRTGGISSAEDIIASKDAGIKLNQWFAGFFDMFCRYGFNTYREIISNL